MPEANGLYYEEHGSGPPLILSAGLGGSATYWAPNIPALAEHFRVIAYDHRGTGRSDRNLPEDVTVSGMAEDLTLLMDALDLARCHVVGHALGGLIGLDALSTHDRIDKLVVVNAWTGWDDGLDPHTARCFDVRLDLLRYAGNSAYLRAQPIFLYPAGWISAHSATLDATLSAQASELPPVETIERRIAALRNWKLWMDLPLSADWLVIGAKDDMLVPVEASRRLAEVLVCAQYVEMDWGGHACNVTDPDTFNTLVLDFLRS